MISNKIQPYPNILVARICSVFWLILVLLQIVQVFSIVFKSEFNFASRVFVESTWPAWAVTVTLIYLTSVVDQSTLSWKKALSSFIVILAVYGTFRFFLFFVVMNFAAIGVISSWLVNVVIIIIVFVKIYKTKSTLL